MKGTGKLFKKFFSIYNINFVIQRPGENIFWLVARKVNFCKNEFGSGINI